MNFTRIEGINFKGGVFGTDLKKVTVIRGRNFVGKTSRIEALELAATDAVRAVGKQGSVLHEAFASGTQMVVTATTSENELMRVCLSQGRKGTVSMETSGPKLDPMVFSPAGFTGLSGPERLKYLFSVLPPPPLEKVGPEAIIAKLKNIKLEPHTKEAEEVINNLCQFVRDDYSGAIGAKAPLGELLDALLSTQAIEKKWAKDYREGADEGAAVTIQDWLSILAEQVRVRANAAAAAVKRMKATATGTAELQLGQRQASLAQAEAEVAAARAAAQQIGEQLAGLRTQYREKERQRDEAQAIVNSWVEPDAEAVAGYEGKIALLRASLEAELVVPPPGDNEKAQQKKADDLTAQIAAATDELNRILLVSPQSEADRLQQQRERQARANSAQYSLESKEKEINALVEKVEGIDALECCPTCKASQRGWKKTVLDVLKAELALAAHKLEELKAAAKTSADELEEINGIVAKIDEAKEKRSNLNAKIVAWQKELGEANRKLNAATVERGNAALAARNAQRTELARLEGLLNAAKGSEAKRAEYNAAKAKVAQMQTEMDGIKASGETLKEQQASADERVLRAEETHRGAVSAAAAAQTAAKAMEEAAKAQAEADVTKGLADILAELLRLCVAESVQPLLDTCNRIAAGVLTAPVAIEDGTIGLKRGTKLVGLKTCSDAEQMLINAGLSIALASGQPVKLAIIGRFESLDWVSKHNFITQMLKLVDAGQLDQCIVVEVAATERAAWVSPEIAMHDDFAVVNI